MFEIATMPCTAFRKGYHRLYLPAFVTFIAVFFFYCFQRFCCYNLFCIHFFLAIVFI